MNQQRKEDHRLMVLAAKINGLSITSVYEDGCHFLYNAWGDPWEPLHDADDAKIIAVALRIPVPERSLSDPSVRRFLLECAANQ